MNQKTFLSAFLYSAALLICFNAISYGQDRPRIIGNEPIKKTVYSAPTNTSLPSQAIQQVTTPKVNSISRPVLTNQLVVANQNKTSAPLIKKTVSSSPTNPVPANFALSPMVAAFNQRLTQSMDSKLGIRYVYGSTGPNTYDCSGLVWAVFQEAGIDFDRSSARTYWQEFEPVYGEDRFKFGTLVFFNGLGHVGIVVNDKGFYHASSSKGVTYSSFEGYWEKRIVGYRRIPESMINF